MNIQIVELAWTDINSDGFRISPRWGRRHSRGVQTQDVANFSQETAWNWRNLGGAHVPRASFDTPLINVSFLCSLHRCTSTDKCHGFIHGTEGEADNCYVIVCGGDQIFLPQTKDVAFAGLEISLKNLFKNLKLTVTWSSLLVSYYLSIFVSALFVLQV